MATIPPPKSRSSAPAVLVSLGAGLFTLERLGLSKIEGPDKSVHLDPNLLSALVIVPVLLVVAGAVMFVVGRMRRR